MLHANASDIKDIFFLFEKWVLKPVEQTISLLDTGGRVINYLISAKAASAAVVDKDAS